MKKKIITGIIRDLSRLFSNQISHLISKRCPQMDIYCLNCYNHFLAFDKVFLRLDGCNHILCRACFRGRRKCICNMPLDWATYDVVTVMELNRLYHSLNEFLSKIGVARHVDHGDYVNELYTKLLWFRQSVLFTFIFPLSLVHVCTWSLRCHIKIAREGARIQKIFNKHDWNGSLAFHRYNPYRQFSEENGRWRALAWNRYHR